MAEATLGENSRAQAMLEVSISQRVISSRPHNLIREIFGSALRPTLQRKSTVQSSESYQISEGYISRRATEHSPRLNCFRLSRTGYRDRNVDFLLNRKAHIDPDRVATLQPSLALQSIGCAEARQ